MKQKLLEKRFLIYFLSDKKGLRDIKTIQAMLSGGLDWNFILEKTISHGACPLLYDYLKKTNLLPLLPKTIIKTLQKAYYHTAFINMQKYNQLKIVLKTLQDKKMPVLLVKGVILAEMVYQNIALRPMGDIDIITRNKTEEKKIKEITCTINHSLTLDIDYIPNDIIHFTFEWPYEKKTRFIKELWKRAKLHEIEGIQIYIPCLEDFLLCQLMNLSREGIFYLRYLIDLLKFLHLFSLQINWRLVAQKITSYKLEKRCWFIFDFLNSFSQLPPECKEIFLKENININANVKLLWNMQKQNFLLVDLPAHIIRKLWSDDFHLGILFFPTKRERREKFPIHNKSANRYYHNFFRYGHLIQKYIPIALPFFYYFLKNSVFSTNPLFNKGY